MNRRAEILRQLIRYEKPTEPLLRELKAFGWESKKGPLVILKKGDFLNILDRFLGGEITAAELQEWAWNLEVREDVAFDEDDEEVLESVLFGIANPAANEPLTLEAVSKIRDELAEPED